MHQYLKRKVLHVAGMTCSSCEIRIENTLKKIAGVQNVKAVYSEAKVYVTYNANETGIYRLMQLIGKLGYKARLSSNSINRGNINKKQTKVRGKSGKLKTGQLIGICIMLAAIYVIINNTVGFNLIPDVDQSMSYGLLFVAGLLTSFHCIAMCGGINLSQCLGYKSFDGSSKLSRFKPSFLYNLGRVISYTLIRLNFSELKFITIPVNIGPYLLV